MAIALTVLLAVLAELKESVVLEMPFLKYVLWFLPDVEYADYEERYNAGGK